MGKEILTLDIIKADLKKRLLLEELISPIITAVLLSVTTVVCDFVFRLLLNGDQTHIMRFKPSLLAVIVLVLVNTLILFSFIKGVTKLIGAIKNGHFNVTEKKLTDIKEGEYHRTSKVRTSIPYELCFYPYENYRIPARKHYTWSKEHQMNEKEIYKSSEIGDDFILVTQKNTILLAYNTKFFKLEDENDR